MSRRLYLARHGETEANRLKIIQGQNKQQPNYGNCLNSRGENQAVLLGEALTDVKFQFVYSSLARRAFDTAHLILTYNKHAWHRATENTLFEVKRIEVKNELLELDHGAFEGMSGEDVKTRYPELYALYETKPSQFTFPQGESIMEAYDRVGRAIFKILFHRNTDENILIVSHGGVMALVLIYIFQLDLDTMFHAIRHHNSGLSIIEWGKPDSPRIICLNDISHLKSEHAQRLRD